MSPHAGEGGEDAASSSASAEMFDDGRFCGDDGPPVKRVVLEDVSAHVNHVYVDGLARTKDDIVAKVCSEVFKAGNFAGKIFEFLFFRSSHPFYLNAYVNAIFRCGKHLHILRGCVRLSVCHIFSSMAEDRGF